MLVHLNIIYFAWLSVLDPTTIKKPIQNELRLERLSDLQFECFVNYSKINSLSFQWIKDGIILVNNSNTSYVYSKEGVTLKVTSLRSGDSGIYQCIVSTTHGFNSAPNVSIHLTLRGT